VPGSILILAIGCTSEPIVELRIDSELPVVWQQALVEGAEEWFAAVPEARVPILIVDDKPNVIASSCGPDSFGCRQRREDGHGVISLEVERVVQSGRKLDELELRVARHEVGHWLGISGHLAHGNAMAPTIGSTSRHLTPADIAELRASLPR
jgi:hypothetical protein